MPWVKLLTGGKKPPDVFLRELPNEAFVLAPAGHGLDTHRAWEALLAGCFVVTFSSHLDSLFVGLPVLIVEYVEDITEQLLLDTYAQWWNASWEWDRVFMPHWEALALDQGFRRDRMWKIEEGGGWCAKHNLSES
jgi:hypothetical protein